MLVYIDKNIDNSKWSESDRVSTMSFNKSAVTGAQNELYAEPLDVILSRHISGISKYYHLMPVVDNFNVMFNLDIGSNANKVDNISSNMVNVWKDGQKYLKELLGDIQGVVKNPTDSWLSGIGHYLGKIRSGYAKFQLGFNPKVWITQLSSFFASTSILDYNSIFKGFTLKVDDVDEFCPLAKLRNYENAVALAQGVIDKVDKVGDVLMKPIGVMDRFVIKKLFGACQVQVEKNRGLKVGTLENKQKAGELLKTVIFETQQNSLASERSKAMRSTNDFSKAITMFSADAMKLTGRVIDTLGELSVLKAKKRIATDTSEIANLNKRIKEIEKKVAKSLLAILTSATFMALVAQAFKTLYNKDDEEENIAENIAVDAFGNLLGGLPLIRDAYSRVADGYSVDGYAYSALNDLLDSFASVKDLTVNMATGNFDSKELALNLKNTTYAVCQILGIPIRNIYNVGYGLINRVSPETGYVINNTFYKQSYNADLKKAIENNDEDMISTIAVLIMNENAGAFENKQTRNEVDRLITAGNDVLPQSIGSSMTIDGETFTLTESQKQDFKKIYNNSIEKVDALVSSKGYRIASDEAKAKAIKYIYKYYFYEAQQDLFDVELDNKIYLFGQILPIEKMALALAEAPIIAEKSTNKKSSVQAYLQRSKLTAIQKYILMGYFGYKNTYGESQVKALISKTNLSKKQREILLEKCGYKTTKAV